MILNPPRPNPGAQEEKNNKKNENRHLQLPDLAPEVLHSLKNFQIRSKGKKFCGLSRASHQGYKIDLFLLHTKTSFDWH